MSVARQVLSLTTEQPEKDSRVKERRWEG